MKTSALATILFTLVSLGIANLLQAQEKIGKVMRETTPEKRAEVQTNHMKERLALAEEQVPRIYDLNLKYARKMQNAYDSATAKLQLAKQMKSIRDQKDMELKAMLTPGQYESYEKL